MDIKKYKNGVITGLLLDKLLNDIKLLVFPREKQQRDFIIDYFTLDSIKQTYEAFFLTLFKRLGYRPTHFEIDIKPSRTTDSEGNFLYYDDEIRIEVSGDTFTFKILLFHLWIKENKLNVDFFINNIKEKIKPNKYFINPNQKQYFEDDFIVNFEKIKKESFNKNGFVFLKNLFNYFETRDYWEKESRKLFCEVIEPHLSEKLQYTVLEAIECLQKTDYSKNITKEKSATLSVMFSTLEKLRKIVILDTLDFGKLKRMTQEGNINILEHEKYYTGRSTTLLQNQVLIRKI